jgi:hypothetical protein
MHRYGRGANYYQSSDFLLHLQRDVRAALDTLVRNIRGTGADADVALLNVSASFSHRAILSCMIVFPLSRTWIGWKTRCSMPHSCTSLQRAWQLRDVTYLYTICFSPCRKHNLEMECIELMAQQDPPPVRLLTVLRNCFVIDFVAAPQHRGH